MTSRTIVSIVATPDLIKELQKCENDEIWMTEPSRIDSSADVLDAPLTPDQVKEILEFVKVVLETGVAATAFYTALLAAVRTLKTPVVVKDSETGKTKGVIDPNTSDEDAKKVVGL